MAGEDLTGKSCTPCRGGIPPLERSAAEGYLGGLPGWSIAGEPMRVEKTYRFQTFLEAQTFAAMVGTMSEAEGHHPEIRYGWGYCNVAFWTHKINGLHENDFIMAAKISGLAAALQVGG